MNNKFIYILIIVFGGLFVACEPNTDINEELDKTLKEQAERNAKFADKTIATEEYTLVEADYAHSSNENLSKHKSFSSSISAEKYMPEILNAILFSDTKAFEMKVTYAYFNPSSKEDFIKPDYILSESDYKTELGFSYTNFSKKEDGLKYTPILANHIYKYDSYSTSSVIEFNYTGKESSYSKWTFDGTKWTEVEETSIGGTVKMDISDAYTLTDEDYKKITTVGDVAKYKSIKAYERENALEKFLEEYDRGTTTEILIEYNLFKYDNKGYIAVEKGEDGEWTANTLFSFYWDFESAKWIQKANEYTGTQSALFAFKESVWKFVPPLKLVKTDKASTKTYALTNDDYELVGNGYRNNFDIREGKNEEDEAVRIAKITQILKTRVELVLGDVYEVSYAAWNHEDLNLKITLEVVADN